jgi:hypothetical protein
MEEELGDFDPNISVINAYVYTVTGEFVKSLSMSDFKILNDRTFI